MYFVVRQLARVFSTVLLAISLAACSQSTPNASVAAPKPDKNSGGKRDGDNSQRYKRDATNAEDGPQNSNENRPSITIADKAAEQLATLAQEGGVELDRVVIIGVKEGGDIVFKNGGDTRYKYTLMQTDDPVDWDGLFRVESNGITIGVDKKIARFLDGLAVSLAYVDGGARLRFDNPNVARVMTSSGPAAENTPSPTAAELEPIPHVNNSAPDGPVENGTPDPPSVLDAPPRSD